MLLLQLAKLPIRSGSHRNSAKILGSIRSFTVSNVHCGVPKKRVTLEKRWCKQMGAEDWYWKMLIPKYNIRICETCGHHYEAKHLCRNCYERVKTETEEIRKKIEADIGNNPEDKGVVVVYENEKDMVDLTKAKLENRRLVEIPKPRPPWFSSNLLQKTMTVPDHETTTVATTKPNLG